MLPSFLNFLSDKLVDAKWIEACGKIDLNALQKISTHLVLVTSIVHQQVLVKFAEEKKNLPPENQALQLVKEEMVKMDTKFASTVPENESN